MQVAPLPADEAVRLHALYRCGILDTPAEPSFDGLASLAAAVCAAPIALVTLIDPRRQWFKSKIGLSVSETPRDIAFCAHTILGRGLFIVEDADADVRFADNPLVTGDPHIRFYAGAPVVLSDGAALGTVAVIDTVPRRLSTEQASLLATLAGQAAALLENRRRVKPFEREPRAPGQHLHYVDLGFRVAMWEWEPATGRLAWTPHLEELYGVSAGSIRHYDDFRRLVHPEDLAGLEATRDEAVRNHRPFDLEFRIVKTNGEIRWVSSRGSASYDETGNPVLVMGNTHDITALKETEEALRASRRQMQSIVEGTTDAVFIKDVKGRYLLFNGAAGRFVGKHPDQVLGHDDTAIFPSSQAESLMARDRVVMAGGKIVTFEEGPLKTADGEDRIFLSTKGPLHDDKGAVSGLFGIARDITERRRMSEVLEQRVAERTAEIRAREAEFARLIVNFPGVVSRVDRDLRYRYVSPQYEEWFGKKPGDVIGLTIADVIGQASFERAKPAVEQALAGRSVTFENVVTTPAGEARHGLVTFEPEFEKDGACAGFAIFAVDITERKRAEEALRDSYRRLQDLSREVQMAEERGWNRLSHELHDEFGQLLSALKYDTKTLGSGLARRRALTEVTRKRLAVITDTVDRLFDSLHTMVRGLRPAVLEKLGLGVALESLVEDTEARFRLVCRLETDGLATPTGFGAELEATLYRMTQELLTNVTRHAKASHVTIRLERRAGAVALTVADDGVGFASSSERYGLRGIRERAEILGGQVAIDSPPGAGTTVTVTIPLPAPSAHETAVIPGSFVSPVPQEGSQ